MFTAPGGRRAGVPVRVQAFLAGRDFPGFNPDSEGTKPGVQTPLALAEEFARCAVRACGCLKSSRRPTWSVRRGMPELGMVTLNEMVHNWAAHDLNHTVQAERALMQPFHPGLRSVKKYFADHLIGIEYK